MKLMQTHFDEYLVCLNKKNLHPKIDNMYNSFPTKLENLSNLLFYGPKGVGKYSQCLSLISKYSPTKLKYEKKTCIMFNKCPFFIKISDIHYEVDMSLLGCNSKLLWHEIYLHIIDIISTKKERIGIILCKFFNQIHNELLETFYSYMQSDYFLGVKLKFIIITTDIGFISENIINSCKVINVARPSNSNYNSCIKEYNNYTGLSENISNIKTLSISNDALMVPYKMICDKIIENIINYEKISYYKFREVLYDVLIYDLNIGDSIWYILSAIITKKILKEPELSSVLTKSYEFFKYYNNNYRPIYHLENYFLTIVKIIYHL